MPLPAGCCGQEVAPLKSASGARASGVRSFITFHSNLFELLRVTSRRRVMTATLASSCRELNEPAWRSSSPIRRMVGRGRRRANLAVKITYSTKTRTRTATNSQRGASTLAASCALTRQPPRSTISSPGPGAVMRPVGASLRRSRRTAPEVNPSEENPRRRGGPSSGLRRGARRGTRVRHRRAGCRIALLRMRCHVLTATAPQFGAARGNVGQRHVPRRPTEHEKKHGAVGCVGYAGGRLRRYD